LWSVEVADAAPIAEVDTTGPMIWYNSRTFGP
jgi:hypothetical protein